MSGRRARAIRHALRSGRQWRSLVELGTRATRHDPPSGTKGPPGVTVQTPSRATYRQAKRAWTRLPWTLRRAS